MPGKGKHVTEFQSPDWNKPLDLAEHLAAIPKESTVKGVFFRSAIEQCREATGDAPGRDHYNALSNYPTLELAEVLAQCAERIYPSLSLRKGLRHLGANVFPRLRKTAVGNLIFGTVGRELTSALKMTSRAYKAFSNNVSAELTTTDSNLVVLELRNAWTFPDSYHVGIFEGAIKSYGKHGMITLHEHTPCDLDLQIYFA